MIEIKGWSQNDIKYLKENYVKYTNKELASYFGKTIGAIDHAARRLKLIKQPHKPWTKEEDSFLQEHYIDMTSEELGKIFGRTIHSINARRDDLGLIRNPNWTEVEENFLMEHYETMTHAEVGKLLGKTEQSVRAKFFDMGLRKKEPDWTEEDLNFLLTNYPYMCTKELAEILGRTVFSVSLKANRSGITKFPYYCDYHFFDEINTEEKAYWLGFLTADGWISKRKDGTGKVTGIELQYGDIEHLKKFNKSIEGNYQITDRWRPCLISTKDKTKENHSCVIRVYSSIMHDSLVEMGFTYNKSFDATIPNMKDYLYRHFVRGFFDGNGTICLSRNNIGVNFCTASIQLKNDLISLLNRFGITIKDYSYKNENGIMIYRPEATNNVNKYALLDFMYKDATIYLDRKYKRYLKAKKYAEQKDNEGLAS